MSEPKWKDISTFSRGDKTREPRTFELRLDGGLRICVTRMVDCGPNDWVLRCSPWFPAYVLASGDVEKAKAESLAMVRGMLERALESSIDAGGGE